MADSMPALEMLWEARDPETTLTERFGFQDARVAARWVAAVVAEHWDVEVRSCERIVMSDRNALAWIGTSAGRFVLKWSVTPERFRRLSRVASLTRWLAGAGFPVSAPLPSLDGCGQVEADGVSMCLQHVIEGALLDVDDPEQVHASGAVLARLHHALAAYPEADRLIDRASLGPLPARITNWLDSAPPQVPRRIRDSLRELVAGSPTDQLPSQLIHGDFRSSNVLCEGKEVAAVIDFEEVRIDHCIVELARSAVMLGTRFRDWGPVSAEVRAQFLAGYQSVRRLTPIEARWWDVLVLWYAAALVPHGDDPTGWGSSALSHLGQVQSRSG